MIVPQNVEFQAKSTRRRRHPKIHYSTQNKKLPLTELFSLPLPLTNFKKKLSGSQTFILN